VRAAVTVAALLVVLRAPAAWAQGPAAGVKIGANFASFSPTEEGEATPPKRTALVAGVFATVPVNGRFAFQPELLYSMQGATFANDGGTIELDYVQVPLLARFDVRPRSPVVFILTGPSIGIRMRARVEARPGRGESDSFDFSDEVKRIDPGLVAAVAVGVGRFAVEGRYSWGLSSLPEDGDGGTAKNRVAALIMNVRF
jgi:hypothetical protein